MEFTAKQIAEFLHGEVDGDENIMVNNFAKIEEGKPYCLSFLSNAKYESYIYTTQSSIVLVNKNFIPTNPIATTLIRVENAYASIAQLLQLVDKANVQKKEEISPLSCIEECAEVGERCYIAPFAVVSKGAKVGNDCQIYPHVFIGENVRIGEGTTIYPNVSIYKDCVIGKNCIFHSGVVIGADGFGFAPEGEKYKKIPQLGNVEIGDNVEIGANTTIDRAVMGSTKIGNGVKLDNLVQIAHNVEVGENSVMAAQTGIAGSTHIGKHCTFAGQVGVVGHLSIGDNVTLGGKSGIMSSVESGETMFGSPIAFPHKQFLRMMVHTKNLPQMAEHLRKLEKEIEKLKAQLNQ